MNIRNVIPGALSACLLCSAAAHGAGFGGPYVAVGGGQSQFGTLSGDFDERSTAYKGFVGYAFGDYLALEAAYFSTGDHSANVRGVELTSTFAGFNGSILLRAPKGGAFAFYIKAGYASYDYELHTANPNARTSSDSRTDISYGAGFNFVLRNGLMLRLEIEGIDIGRLDFAIPVAGVGNVNIGDADLNLTTLLVGYQF